MNRARVLPIVWETDPDAMLRRMGEVANELRAVRRAYPMSLDPMLRLRITRLQDEYSALDEARVYARRMRGAPRGYRSHGQ